MSTTFKKLFLIPDSKPTINPCPKRLKQLQSIFPQLQISVLEQIAISNGFDCLLLTDTTFIGQIFLAPSCLLFIGRKLHLTLRRPEKANSYVRKIPYSSMREISRDTKGILYRDNINMSILDEKPISLSFTRQCHTVYTELVMRCSLSLLPPQATKLNSETKSEKETFDRQSSIEFNTSIPVTPIKRSDSLRIKLFKKERVKSMISKPNSPRQSSPLVENLSIKRAESAGGSFNHSPVLKSIKEASPKNNVKNKPRPLTFHATCPVVYTENRTQSHLPLPELTPVTISSSDSVAPSPIIINQDKLESNPPVVLPPPQCNIPVNSKKDESQDVSVLYIVIILCLSLILFALTYHQRVTLTMLESHLRYPNLS